MLTRQGVKTQKVQADTIRTRYRHAIGRSHDRFYCQATKISTPSYQRKVRFNFSSGRQAY